MRAASAAPVAACRNAIAMMASRKPGLKTFRIRSLHSTALCCTNGCQQRQPLRPLQTASRRQGSSGSVCRCTAADELPHQPEQQSGNGADASGHSSDEPLRRELFSSSCTGDGSDGTSDTAHGSGVLALLRRIFAAVRWHAAALLFAAVVAAGLFLGAGRTAHIQREAAAASHAPVASAAPAEHRHQQHSQQPTASSFSLQDRALLLDGQRQARQRPKSSPVWISGSTPRSQPDGDELIAVARPATRFASVGAKALPISATGYRFLGVGELMSVWLAGWFQELMLSHVLVKIASVFLIGVPVTALMATLYCCVTQGPDWHDWRDAMPAALFKVYGVLYRAPGAKVTEEHNWLAGLVMNVVFLLGLFTFAIVLGIITEEIKTQVRDVKNGNYAVLQTDHTLVLGWNSAAVPLLRQMAMTKAQYPRPTAFQSLGLGGPLTNLRGAPVFDGPVVILADHPKESMDAAVAGALARDRHLHVLTREGSPHFLRDLEGVSAGQAKTIIVLQPDTAKEPFKNTAATVMALRTTRSHWHPSLQAAEQNVVIQTAPDARPVPRTALSGAPETHSHMDFQLLRVNTASDIWRLMAQTSIQPGVANVYCSVVQQSRGSAGLVIADQAHSDFAGDTYRDARKTFDNGVVIGYVDRDGARSAHLNPPDEYVLQRGDRLVVLTDNSRSPHQHTSMFTNSEYIGRYPSNDADDDAGASVPMAAQPGTLHSSAGIPDESAEPRSTTATEISGRTAGHQGCARSKHVVVVGWPGNIRDISDGLADFAPPHSQVTVISRGRPEDLPEEHGSCTFTHVDGSTTTSASYTAAGLASADAVIIGEREGVSSKEADAHLLFALMQVQEHVMDVDRARPLHVVSTVRHPETLEVAQHIIQDVGMNCVTAELLDPDELVSGIITQVAADPHLGAVLSELVETSAGHEIYLRRPDHFKLLPDTPVTFEEVIEQARSIGETAIGFIEEDGSLNLSPKKGELSSFNEHSRIVVIAEEM